MRAEISRHPFLKRCEVLYGGALKASMPNGAQKVVPNNSQSDRKESPFLRHIVCDNVLYHTLNEHGRGWHKRADYRAFTRALAGAALRADAKSCETLPRVFYGADQQRSYPTSLCERDPPLCRLVRLQRPSRARAGRAFPCRRLRARPAGRAFTAVRQTAPGGDSHPLRLAGDRACY